METQNTRDAVQTGVAESLTLWPRYVTEAARALGVHRSTVHRWLKRGCPDVDENGCFNLYLIGRWREREFQRSRGVRVV
jgi:IS30 family transposase